MHPELAEGIGITMAMISIGTMILIGMKMRLNARLRESSGTDNEELERLGDTVDNLHEQVRLMRDEFAELNERVDFTERLLARGSDHAKEQAVPTPT